ncbi:type II toxin-antitoxin system toxin DNA ADP-ribosyl transferase DarT [Streptomyces sp. CA-288835]|uniref:type II toxin-antitoxin system toxin DNA ADP-ribosyl transferase DarT n=1 Tax=Streptomyces sp. CA-288835 TaxID=3240069 RepID=UPI003D8F1C64
MLPPEDRPIYHFTHISNLPNVLDQGCINCDRIVREDRSLQVECGDQAIKERRRLRKVDPFPGGVVADYVPFYFAPRSPMLYKIRKGSVPTYADGQDPLVYLVTSPRRLVETGCVSVFSDGNCAADITAIESDLARLGSHVDWSVMERERWNNTPEDPDRMRRRMAEFLVHERVPVAAVTHLAVRTQSRADAVRQLLDGRNLRLDVIVRPAWYY